MEPVAREHHAGFHQLFVELPISVRSCSLASRLPESLVALINHESHRRVSFLI